MNLMMSTRQVDGVTIVDMKGRIILGEQERCTARLGVRPVKGGA